jgi:hypothetical protein
MVSSGVSLECSSTLAKEEDFECEEEIRFCTTKDILSLSHMFLAKYWTVGIETLTLESEELESMLNDKV